MPFRRSKDVDIQPGQAFHLPAAQQTNMSSLLKVLSSKPATEALTEMAKVKSDTWSDIKEVTGNLQQIVTLGGASPILDSIKETVSLQIESLLAPIQNEINQSITNLLAPLQALLQPLINDLASFLGENKVGAGVGGIIGGVASLFLPGGPILIAIGAIIGAQFEKWLGDLADMAAEGDVLGVTEAVLTLPSTPAALGLGIGFDLGVWLANLLFGGGGSPEEPVEGVRESGAFF